MNKTFLVNFFETRNGVQSRQRVQGNSTVHLSGATSEFAVQSYLKRMYPNSEISINSVEWR